MANNSKRKGVWEPPRFVKEALHLQPITQDGEHPQKRYYRCARRGGASLCRFELICRFTHFVVELNTPQLSNRLPSYHSLPLPPGRALTATRCRTTTPSTTLPTPPRWTGACSTQRWPTPWCGFSTWAAASGA